MLPLGLSASEQRAFHRALRSHHEMKTTVQVMNLNRERLADVSLRLVDGIVNVTNDAETTRGASLNLWDPKGAIALDSGNPSDGALYYNNAIRVVNSYHWAGMPGSLDGWVDVPVFDGPVTSVNRDAQTLAVECQGWESRARQPAWDPHVYGPLHFIVDTIRRLMQLAGETRFDMPSWRDLPRVSTSSLSLSRTGQPWAHAQRLAAAIDRQLFYDGRGVLRLRRLPRRPCWTFTDGDPHGTITQDVRTSYDLSNLRNVVWVKGRKPKGEDRAEDYRALPGANPLSPWALARNGKPLWLLEVVENEHLKTDRECEDRAVDLVNEFALQSATTEFDAMPVPHFDPGDLVAVDSGKLQRDFRLRAFTIPLAPDPQGAAFGYTRELVTGRKAKHRPIGPLTLHDKEHVEWHPKSEKT